jgi:site-specific recombinase XerD
LFDSPRDFTRFDREQHGNLDNPWLLWAQHTARWLGEARGWTKWVASDVDRALVILLSQHCEGDTVRHSELSPALRAHGLSAERTIEVLAQIGIFDDDRVPSFTRWLDRKLVGVAPSIRRDVESWLGLLRDGGPRNQPRAQKTIWSYLHEIRPALLDWSARYHHLREVTRDDIVAVRDGCHGKQRESVIVALRSLFRHCKKAGAIFRDPTARIRVGRQDYKVVHPLKPDEIAKAVTVATTPAVRLILALAAVHAARPKAIRDLLLDDIDLGNRRIVITGHARPLDELTHRAILDWLDSRRTRWPNTANPHLLITQQTALEAGPVGRHWVTEAVRRQAATLERLRVDRQLEEALTHGPDPLHLSVVFGLDEKTAIRYAAAARQLIETHIERDTSG